MTLGCKLCLIVFHHYNTRLLRSQFYISLLSPPIIQDTALPILGNGLPTYPSLLNPTVPSSRRTSCSRGRAPRCTVSEPIKLRFQTSGPSPKATLNGPEALQFAAGQAVNCNRYHV